MNTERTPAFLMANLGSEVSRVYAAREACDMARIEQSFTRALSILERLREHPLLAGRTAEIEILQDVLMDSATAHPRYAVSKGQFEAYFLPFAQRVLS